MNKLNKHIEEFLEYYIDLSYAPKYAVLIKGAWGSGKTYLVDCFFKDLAAKREEQDNKGPAFLYVSLYGVTNTRAIEEAFFTQLHPVLGSKGMRLAGKIFKNLLKTSIKFDLDGDGKADGSVSSQVPDFEIPEYIKNSNNIPLVFDDLERCAMPIKDVLGYINSFVEHDDCKVIILCDEDKISNHEKQAYANIKEKLIGKTFEVRPEFEAAFNLFLESIDKKKIKKFYKTRSSEIRMLFNQSKSRNLRTLQRVMWDFERFASCLKKNHMEHDEAMRDIFRVFFAMSFEIKAGRITGDKIAKFGSNNWAAVFKENNNDKLTEVQKLKKTYPEVPFDQTLLSNGILADVLVNNIIDENIIHESLNRHQYFVPAETEKAWHILRDATIRDQKLVSETLIKFEKQFKNREFTITGEILHVAGIRLWLADISAIKQSRNEVFQEMKTYVDDLYELGKLENTKDKFSENHLYMGSYAGLTFNEENSKEFEEFSFYLNSLQVRSLKDSYVDKAKALMDEMTEDTDLYFLRLCINNSDKQLYYNTPILTYVKPSDYVDKLLSLNPKQQHLAISVFKARYQHPNTTKSLVREKMWLQKVRKILNERADKMDPIPKHAIEIWIKWYIDISLERF